MLRMRSKLAIEGLDRQSIFTLQLSHGHTGLDSYKPESSIDHRDAEEEKRAVRNAGFDVVAFPLRFKLSVRALAPGRCKWKITLAGHVPVYSACHYHGCMSHWNSRPPKQSVIRADFLSPDHDVSECR